MKVKTPLSEELIEQLKVGDIVYISGTIFTARDQAHKRIIEKGAPFPIKGSVIFHAGPLVKENKNTETGYEMIAIGPTTSMRMNPYQADVINMGVKAVIGKGGMNEETQDALKENNAVYLAAVGGCAALYTNTIKEIKSVNWLDLGIPEAIWELKVENFGPLVVAMDSHKKSIY